RASGPYPATADVQRSNGIDPYVTVGSVTFDGSGGATFTDNSVQPQSQYRYALQLLTPVGLQVMGERTVTTPGHVLPQLLFVGTVPNPTKVSLRVQFTLPDDAPADLRLFDTTGRQLHRL